MFPRAFLTIALVSLFHQAVLAQGEPKEKDRMAIAIKKGQRFLKNLYDPQGAGPQANPMGGIMAMAGFRGNGQAAISGLAMLESGLPANDPSVTVVANGLRRNALTITNTYEVSLIIMFLDRLGERKDEALIQFMTLRLLTGQCFDGTWGYECAGLYLDPVELKQMYGVLVRESKMVSAPPGKAPGSPPGKKAPRGDIDFGPKTPDPKKPKSEEKEEPATDEPLNGLHPSLRKYGKEISEGRTIDAPADNRRPRGPIPGIFPGNAGRAASGDHSNTQFATVGMWCGRRHFVDTNNAFKQLEKHYRDAQGPDGGWGYAGTGVGSTPAMTCAGLMGLAMGFGAKNAKLATPGGAGGRGDKGGGAGADPANDKVMENGLKCLGDYLAAASAAQDRKGGQPRFQQTELSTNLYFMWSLERVAMIYGLQTIGKVDWYAWGSECLLDSQQGNGAWASGNYHGSTPELDTAFALLFLNRANLAQDLSASMKGKVRDPGTSRLIGGGDLAKLLGPGSKSGSGSTTRKPEPKRDPGPDPTNTPENPKNEPKTVAPPAANEFEAKVRALVRAVVDGDPSDQGRLIEAYRDAKGGEHTEALAQIATRLGDDPQAKARAALASRLTRMKAATLTEYLRDRDRELRRAAAIASGAKGEKSLAPELIRLLADTDSGVIQAARGGLKQLSGQDFGPGVNATAGEKSKAVLAWRNWWEGAKK